MGKSSKRTEGGETRSNALFFLLAVCRTWFSHVIVFLIPSHRTGLYLMKDKSMRSILRASTLLPVLTCIFCCLHSNFLTYRIIVGDLLDSISPGALSQAPITSHLNRCLGQRGLPCYGMTAVHV